jgi:DNA repair photolyase
MVDLLPDRPHKGRGAIGNPTGRFEPTTRVPVDDGWSPIRPDAGEEDEPPPLRTTVTADVARTIIARNQSPDIPFDQSINPYRGCEHGCIYCYARPTHAYLGLSTGLDFETRLFAKFDAAKLLAAELRKPGYRVSTISLGANTDPYQPVERDLKITRSILEVLAAFQHPVSIVTKSALVLRDLDILAPMAEKRLAKVFISVTTLDRDLARKLEPRASTPPRRLAAIRALVEAGVPVGVMTAPIIPVLTDRELESLLGAAREAGAVSAGYVLMRLPLEIKDLFGQWLEAYAPLKAKHVLAMVRETRDGRLNDAAFGRRLRGTGPYAELIAQRFRLACARLGLNENDRRLDCTRFHVPPAPGDQLRLF